MNTNELICNGRYIIIAPIGEGGMGSVYLAEDTDTGSQVAVKEQEKTERNSTQLKNEIRIQQTLDHPLLPKVYEVKEDAEKILIVMEYIKGRTLADELALVGRIDEKRAYKWAMQIVSVYKCLHNRDNPIVYRDLKPSNLMIDDNDDLHLIDFGIAQEYGDYEKYKKGSHGFTRGYAAPEQYDTRYSSDARTDIYSFGVTMHYMLTGKNPAKPPYTFDKVRRLNKSLSRGMESIIFRCLQPNPDKRYENIDALEKDLKEINGLNERLDKEATVKKVVIGAASVLLALIFILMLVFFKRSGTKRIDDYAENIREARTCIESGDYDKAYEDLTAAIDSSPEIPDAYIYMIPYYHHTKGMDAALDYVRDTVMDKFPDILDNDLFVEQIGLMYYSEERYDDALNYYQILYDKDPLNEHYRDMYNKLSEK